jgi:hypothetical protein
VCFGTRAVDFCIRDPLEQALRNLDRPGLAGPASERYSGGGAVGYVFYVDHVLLPFRGTTGTVVLLSSGDADRARASHCIIAAEVRLNLAVRPRMRARLLQAK